ncbi:MAG: AMP-binding protein, partial [archaeon]
IEPEARVATALSNRREAPVVDVAIFKAGAARVPINPALSREAIDHILSDAMPAAVVCDPESIDAVEVALSSRSHRPIRVVVGPEEPPERWRSAAALRETAPKTRPDVSVEPDALAGLFYTGGTTGEPKGVRYTQAGLMTNFLAYAPELGLSSTDTGLVTTPVAHSGGTFLLATLEGRLQAGPVGAHVARLVSAR